MWKFPGLLKQSSGTKEIYLSCKIYNLNHKYLKGNKSVSDVFGPVIRERKIPHLDTNLNTVISLSKLLGTIFNKFCWMNEYKFFEENYINRFANIGKFADNTFL